MHNPILRALTLLALAILPCPAADYHVDSERGDDRADGSAPESAWRSLEKVRSIELKPGDRLLFKAGARWQGVLQPRGSGTAEAPVRIGRYGEGPAPRIDGGGTRDAVLLENLSHVVLEDLEITNLGEKREPWRTGVRILARGAGPVRGVRLARLHVHDVNGDLRKDHEGCGIFFEALPGKDSHFDGLVIEQCRVERTDRNGICQRGYGWPRSRNVIIRGNTLEDIGGDGIKLWGTNGGLIEHNIVRRARARCAEQEAAAGIWPFACDDTVIQFNEVSGTVGTRDGQGFDADYQCRRSLFQYNYSHGNEGGFMLVCGPGRSINEDTVIRYNLSVNDGVKSARVFHFGGASQRTRIYQNTIVLGAHQDLPMMLFTEWNGGTARGVVFTNNLFIVRPGGRATYQLKPAEGVVFEDNHFAGRHEGLPDGIAVHGALPSFAGGLDPLPGLAAAAAFRPAAGAPFPKGRPIADAGTRDLLGTPLPRDGSPAMGALEAAR